MLAVVSAASFNGFQQARGSTDRVEPGNQLFLVVYGTAIRHRSSLSRISAKIGGLDAEVSSAGPAPGYEGLDQVNLQVLRSMAGRGEVEIELMVDGKKASRGICSFK